MIGSHEVPEAIQWHEGMLLAPHHFQQMTWRFEDLLHYHTQSLTPFYWGVRYWPVKIDPGLLVGGRFRVLELEAVMPDGLLVSHGFVEADDLEIDLAPYQEEMRRSPTTIHLVVPAKKPMGGVTGDLRRYTSVEGRPVLDMNTGEGELPIPRLRPRLSLMAGDTPPSKYVSFPLARVEYKNEAFALTDFMPPVLVAERHSPIGGMGLRVVKRLREKVDSLAKKLRSDSLTIGAPMVVEVRHVLQALSASLPYVEAVLTTGAVHPYAVYLALCQLAGNLAAMGESVVPPEFKPYNHNDLHASFTQVSDFIDQMINQAVPESFTAIPFSESSGIFSVTWEPAWRDRRVIIGVRGRPGQTERDVMSWIEGCLIGTETHFPAMRGRRILGIARQRIEREEDLVPTRGVVLFSLALEPEFMTEGEALQIVPVAEDPEDRSPAEIVLYVKAHA